MSKQNERNVLEEANEIVFKRSEEKERQYGPIDESMANAAKIASILIGKYVSTKDMYKCMIALKLSRLNKDYKRDTYVDLCGYTGALAEYQEKMKEEKSFAEEFIKEK